jgi:GNAT superfamily N-acetyltransferase
MSNVRPRKYMKSEIPTFRQAQHGEELGLAELRVRAMRESLEAAGRFDPTRARERFLESFVPAHTHHIVVEGQDVGFVVLREHNEVLVLDHLYIEPRCQGKGIGAHVMRLVQEQASMRGRSVHVGALKGSRSNQFYQRHGFHPLTEGEWDNFYVWHAPSVA